MRSRRFIHGFATVLLALVLVQGAAYSSESAVSSEALESTVVDLAGQVAVKLGIDVPAAVPDSARLRYVSFRLARLLDREPGKGADGWFPRQQIRHALLIASRLDEDALHGGTTMTDSARRQGWMMLRETLEGLDGTLDRLARLGAPRVQAEAAPANDDCSSSTAVGNGSFAVSTVGATNDGSASCGSSSTSPDVWFRYVAPADGLVRFATSGSDYTPALALFDGCPAAGGAELGCDDAGAVSLANETSLVLTVTTGDEILVRVSGFVGDEGTTTLTIGPTGGIEGTATDALSGEPIADVPVGIYSSPLQTWPLRWVLTDESGAFQAIGLDDETYYADASASDSFYGRPAYAREVFEEVSCELGCEASDWTPIAVTAGSVTGEIDFTLDPLGSISGHVVDRAPGGPQPIGEVRIWSSDGALVSGAMIDVDGSYVADRLLAGTYFVTTESYTHLDQLYDGESCPDSVCDVTQGTPVTVASGKTTSGIDFALDELSRISGTVTSTSQPDPGCSKVSARSADGAVQRSGQIALDGAYEISLLPPGDYFVSTDCYDSLDEVWDDVPCLPGCDVTVGDPVTVPVATDVTGIDFTVDRLGKIEGSVVSVASGLPISNNLWAQIKTPGGELVADQKLDSQGHFSIDRLLPGSYVVRVEDEYVVPEPPIYQDEVYDNLPCKYGCDLAGATLVPAVLNATTTGIDFALSECPYRSHESWTDALTVNVFSQACEDIDVGPDFTIY